MLPYNINEFKFDCYIASVKYSGEPMKPDDIS